jgi:hypothetical protein
MRSKSHKDVDFEVSGAASQQALGSFKTFNEAAGVALAHAAVTGGAKLDVIVWNEAGARWLGGDDAVMRYREDPEASVFERYQIKVNAQGRIP